MNESTHTPEDVSFAERLLRHDYQGLCPDSIEGWDQRDPRCPACKFLDEVERKVTELDELHEWLTRDGEAALDLADYRRRTRDAK